MRKTDENGQTLTGAEFLLEKDGGGCKANIGKPQGAGIFLYDELLAGKYTLTEQKAPDRYQLSNKI
nr:prealbumin-like fold domain-containing protein [Anaerococcus senegalensis]